jgi:hypothetical protein
VAGVVDVFAGAGKVHEFRCFFELGARFKLGLDPVFDGFHVVVGGFLDLLDGGRIGLGEVLDQAQQIGAGAGGQRLEFGKAGIRQRDEPGHLHLHTALHVAVLAHDGAQCGKFGGVTAVKRRQGGDGGQAHGAQIVGRAPRSGRGAAADRIACPASTPRNGRNMKLIGSNASPYVRKVRIVMAEKKLDYQFVQENVWADDTTHFQIQPAGQGALPGDGGRRGGV